MRKELLGIALILVAVILISGCVGNGNEETENDVEIEDEPESDGRLTANCLTLEEGTNLIKSDTILCEGTYENSKIFFGSDDITLDCNGATLIGESGSAIEINGRKGAVVKNCKTKGYANGIEIKMASRDFEILNNEFLECKIAGIQIDSASGGTIKDNMITGEEAIGMSLVFAENLLVEDNRIHNTNLGISVYSNSEDNEIINNVVQDSITNGAIVKGPNTFEGNRVCSSVRDLAENDIIADTIATGHNTCDSVNVEITSPEEALLQIDVITCGPC